MVLLQVATTEMFSVLCNPVIKNRNVGVKIRKESDIKKKVEKITFKTFKKWSFKEKFSADTYEQQYIVSSVCKLLCDSLERMKVD